MAEFIAVIERIGKTEDEKMKTKTENGEHRDDSSLEVDEKELEDQVNDLGMFGLINFMVIMDGVRQDLTLNGGKSLRMKMVKPELFSLVLIMLIYTRGGGPPRV